MDLLDNIHIKNLSKILEEVGERVEGNLICDIVPYNYTINQNKEKIHNLQTLAKGKKKIIEIGVNACHSLLIMLLQNPDADYLLFDLGEHNYTRKCIQYVKENFPQTNIDIIYGDSTKTITDYVKNNPDQLNTYDLIHLDGGHSDQVFSIDYANSKELITQKGIVIFDDYDFVNIKNFIDQKVKSKEIIEYDSDHLLHNKFHFIFRYTMIKKN